MAKVFAREQAFIGLGENRELKILKGELFDSDDQLVLDYPDLFAPVAESTDARVASLEQQVKDLLAALGEKTEAKEPAKTATKKTSAAAPADGKELKGEVA